ncbi:hypothetical protein DLAC_11845 [Tieghemostelium lacteum]|uniref:SKI-interacting protein SKIP SNW domain-containing protein n=1 Tax=Tieghemostelium lacteum TaxID=361077 RepID=A0A151Z407_TIELA|nr:hypothetical protein DLAC_11845 [Tieghemostelium lacteum]|eukprot:KYQ88534.1 hypothetical protein DLAC_11845 [Tieghemostelium lacteum]
MTSLESLLPQPKNTYNNQGIKEEEEYYKLHIGNEQQQQQQKKVNEPKIEIKKVIPPYGKRKGYQPKNIEDFGDGGAFPEIHMTQYPLNMGKKGVGISQSTGSQKALVPIQTDSTGRVKHEMILSGGMQGGSKALINSQYSDLLPKNFTEQQLQRPDEEELKETQDRTKNALEKIIGQKIKSNQTGQNIEGKSVVSYVNYTSSTGKDGSKVIRMVEVQHDPLEPPKHRIKKKVQVSGSPPPTVMHSPPKKLTAQEKKEWDIPPCVSNWVNKNGYAIALDKRLNADGRGLQQVEINDKFAQFSQALYISEQQAREEVAARAELEKNLLLKEKEKKQEMMRKLAEDVRLERSGISNNNSNSRQQQQHRNDDRDDRKRIRDESSDSSSSDSSDSDSSDSDNSDSERDDNNSNNDKYEKEKRDRLRLEKKRERERKYRLETTKKSKTTRDQDRDISEKIALGGAMGGARRTEDSVYDQRLFNQSESLSSGFGDDEAYNVYSKPLFNNNPSANSIYRPRVNKNDDFSSVDDILANKRFNNTSTSTNPSTSDPFGMNEFLSSAKNKK